MKNYSIITISWVSSFIGEILSEIRQDILEKTRIFCKTTRFYFIPMGFTTGTLVYHVDKVQLRLNLDQYIFST